MVDTFIVGPPKSGTTLLANQLRTRPEVALSTPKETFWFGTDLRPLRESLGGYLEQLDDAFGRTQGNTHRIEATTLSLASVDAIDQILDQYPVANLVVCTREPGSQITSWMRHLLRYGWLDDAWSPTQRAPIEWLSDYRRVFGVADQVRKLRRHHPEAKIIWHDPFDTGEESRLALLDFLNISVPADTSPTPGDSFGNPAAIPRSRIAFEISKAPAIQRLEAGIKRWLPEKAARTAATAKRKILLNTGSVPMPSLSLELQEWCSAELEDRQAARSLCSFVTCR